MEMTKFSWDLTNLVTPKFLRETEKLWKEKTGETRIKGIREIVDELNCLIQDWVNEGKEVCYPNYSLNTISMTVVSDEEVCLSYCNTERKISAEDLAVIRNYVMYVVRKEHNTRVRQFSNFDLYAKLHESNYTMRVRAIGGQLLLYRPYIHLVLPAEPGSLEMREYKFVPTEYSLTCLKGQLGDFEEMFCKKPQ